MTLQDIMPDWIQLSKTIGAFLKDHHLIKTLDKTILLPISSIKWAITYYTLTLHYIHILLPPFEWYAYQKSIVLIPNLQLYLLL